MRTPTEILRSLVADIEAMQTKNDPDEFGPFDPDSHYSGIDGAMIQWPNLRILLDEAKAALYFENNKGV